jgi:L-2,4-diaminobutyrate transaminase
VSFSPPLCITTTDCDEAIDHFALALDAAMPDLEQLSATA